jgi:hypothetical protein
VVESPDAPSPAPDHPDHVSFVFNELQDLLDDNAVPEPAELTRQPKAIVVW